MITIVTLKTFERATKKLMSKGDIMELAQELQKNPEAGAVIKGTGGVRKMRWATTQGKSGGLRIIYFFQDQKGRIFLITAYAKNEKENLTASEANELKKLTNALKGE